METRTIFFNGPEGPRSVTCPVPVELVQERVVPEDECAADRCQFFGVLHGMRSKLARHGVSVDDVRRGYARIFGVDRMRHLSQELWAIAAAEVRAMSESDVIFRSRIGAFRNESRKQGRKAV